MGAGTDPSEGTALATALLKSLADRARLTIATTHFGELKALKYEDDRFENASVAFDSDTLSPTYALLWGIPGRAMLWPLRHVLAWMLRCSTGPVRCWPLVVTVMSTP